MHRERGSNILVAQFDTASTGRHRLIYAPSFVKTVSDFPKKAYTPYHMVKHTTTLA